MPTYNLPPGCPSPEAALIVLREQDRQRAAWEAKDQALRLELAKMEMLSQRAKDRQKAVEDARLSGKSDAEVEAVWHLYDL